MPAAKKKTMSRTITVSDKVRDYSNEPFVIEKNRKAKELLEKYGFPEEFKSGSSKKK